MRFIKILIVALSVLALAMLDDPPPTGQQHWCETTDATWGVSLETTDGTVPRVDREALCDTGPPTIQTSSINSARALIPEQASFLVVDGKLVAK